LGRLKVLEESRLEGDTLAVMRKVAVAGRRQTTFIRKEELELVSV
jgi:hypothetical protein